MRQETCKARDGQGERHARQETGKPRDVQGKRWARKAMGEGKQQAKERDGQGKRWVKEKTGEGGKRQVRELLVREKRGRRCGCYGMKNKGNCLCRIM